MRNAAAVALIAAIAATGVANAQRVRGTVTDSATAERVAGAVITLSDSAGAFLSRSIAGAEGKFSVPRLAATRRMRVVRIGYHPTDLVIGNDTVVDVRMQPVPSILGAVEASGRRVCPGDPSGGLELWEQARAGLLASVVAREATPPRIRLRLTERTFEPIRHGIIRDSSIVKDAIGDKSFVAARPAWAFAESGYLREHPGGERDYFAPDEAVLLDPSFAGTHCVHAIDGKGPRADQVGIAFEPVKDPARDTLVDIAGVLWLSRRGLTLRSLEFRYTNLEHEVRNAGGEVFFAPMPNGVSLIERWTIHSPILAVDAAPDPSGIRRRRPSRSERRDVRVVAYHETGGEVGSVSWPNGQLWHRALPRVVGRVEDIAGHPVSGAVVWMQGTRDTVRSGVDGRFEMPYVFPGIFVLEASDSVLAPEGIARTIPLRFGLFEAAEKVMILTLHPRADVFELVCPARSYRKGTAVLLAHIVDAQGNPASGAVVDVETRDIGAGGDSLARPRHKRGEASAEGRFVVCGVAHDRPIVIRASKGRESAVVSVDHWRDELAIMTIHLEVSP